MSTVKIPEPVAWVRRHPDGALTDEFLEENAIELVRKQSGAWKPLITTTQAEAYANARAREAQRWQPMETAPAEGRPVLLFAGLYRDGHEYAPTIVVGWHLDKEGWIASSYGGSPIAHLRPKAWMPLPAFPSTPARPESEQ